VIFITDMNKKEKHDLELIVYRLDEQDRRVDLVTSPNLIQNLVIFTRISNLSKKIYSIPKQVFGQKQNKIHNSENPHRSGEQS